MNNIPSSVEIVCQTEYQDIYRIKPYVLLVVDKFLNSTSGNGRSHHFSQYTKPYNKNTESCLRISKNVGDNRIYYNGDNRVYYNDWEVHITTPDKYRFKLKTSGEEFSGNSDEFCGLLRNVARVIECYKNAE